MTSQKPTEIYYGWKIVFAILVMLTFATGLSFYNHAIILNALSQQSNFTVQTASVAVSIFFLSGGFTGLLVAKGVQKFDIRICFCLGALVSGIALASLRWVDSTWQLYLVYSIFGMGFAASNLIPATTLVTRWFHKKRAMALSIASTGLSLGGVVITPVCALLVEANGLKTAAPIMGVMYIVGVIPVVLIWLRPTPESMGLAVDGLEYLEENYSDAAKATRQQRVIPREFLLQGTSFKEARKGRYFWGLSFAYIFLMLAQVGGISHQYGLAREILTEAQTALAVAILPITSIIGRLIGGWIIERISIRLFAFAMMVLQVISLAILAAGVNRVSLCIGLGLFGITVGNLLMLQPLLIADAYGIRDYARIFSMSNLMSSWGTAAGPAILGFVYSINSNTYSLPYLFAGAAGFLGLLLFFSGGKSKV